MPALDLPSLIVGIAAFVAGAVFNATVAFISGEVQATRAEARERKSRLRQSRLEEIDQTLADSNAMLEFYLARSEGRPESEYPEWGSGKYPRSDIGLVGDGEVLRRHRTFSVLALKHKPGQELPFALYDELVATSIEVTNALRSQRERVLSDEPISRLTRQELAELKPLRPPAAEMESQP